MPEGKLHPLWELTLARVREFVRQPEVIFWVFGFPVLLAFALGIAFRNTAPEKLRVAVESRNGLASAGRWPAAVAAKGASLDVAGQRPGAGAGLHAAVMVAALARSTNLVAVVLSPTDAAQALRTGKVALVVRAAEDANGRGRGPAFDYRYDPTRPESRMARLAAEDALERASGRADVTRGREEKVTEPGARYIDFVVPGLIGMNLMGSGMWGLGFAVVQARMQKLLKRLAATPMRRSHYLLSFMLSRLLFLVLEVGAVIGFAWIVFGVAVRGSWTALALISLLGAVTFSGLGLLVAARPKTMEGIAGLMNLVMLPQWLLSGIFFSAARFPEFTQPFIKALPLTSLNDALRAVMNEGASLASNWIEIAIMLAWTVVSFAVALRVFRWQ